MTINSTKKIKSATSNLDREYYGRYDDLDEQCTWPVAKFPEECGIVSQHTISKFLTMNGVTGRRSRALKVMVRSMIAHSNLPESLWGEAIKIAAYILTRVPTKQTT